MRYESKKLAKAYLADKGIKIFQKDIASVIVKEMGIVFHGIGNGLGEYFNHRDVYTVRMKDGTVFEFIRETVDEYGNYSTNSAQFVTRDINLVRCKGTFLGVTL